MMKFNNAHSGDGALKGYNPTPGGIFKNRIIYFRIPQLGIDIKNRHVCTQYNIITNYPVIVILLKTLCKTSCVIQSYTAIADAFPFHWCFILCL